MPYIVNFTDRENKTPITVFDNTSNADTLRTCDVPAAPEVGAESVIEFAVAAEFEPCTQ